MVPILRKEGGSGKKDSLFWADGMWPPRELDIGSRRRIDIAHLGFWHHAPRVKRRNKVCLGQLRIAAIGLTFYVQEEKKGETFLSIRLPRVKEPWSR